NTSAVRMRCPSAGITRIRFEGSATRGGRPLSPAVPSSPDSLVVCTLRAVMMTPMPGNEIVPNEIVLVRHGETEWSSSGQHTSFSDIPLTARGEDQARTLANRLAHYEFALVLMSPRIRAIETCEL